MLSVLESERQALAALDLDALVIARQDKLSLCDDLDATTIGTLDNECRQLAEAAREMNEVNRRVRNLLAANVSARIDALAGRPGTYGIAQAVNF